MIQNICKKCRTVLSSLNQTCPLDDLDHLQRHLLFSLEVSSACSFWSPSATKSVKRICDEVALFGLSCGSARKSLPLLLCKQSSPPSSTTVLFQRPPCHKLRRSALFQSPFSDFKNIVDAIVSSQWFPVTVPPCSFSLLLVISKSIMDHPPPRFSSKGPPVTIPCSLCLLWVISRNDQDRPLQFSSNRPRVPSSSDLSASSQHLLFQYFQEESFDGFASTGPLS